MNKNDLAKVLKTAEIIIMNKEEAVILSKSVVGSSLCKAAIYGKDANCGRFMCALGYSGVQFNPDKVDIYFESKQHAFEGLEVSFEIQQVLFWLFVLPVS